MKQWRILILIICFISCSKYNYSQEIKFNKFSAAYNYLTDADKITKTIRWRDDQSFSSPLPFVFRFGELESEFLNIHSNGYCSYYDSTLDKNLTIFAFWLENLIDRSYKIGSTIPQSLISYKTITINNEQIGVLEYKNAGFESGGINDSLNFQIWAFEHGNKVQIRFGKSYVQNWQVILNVDSPATCILLENINEDIGGCLNGTTSNPTFDSVSGRFTNVPVEGTVYEFNYITTGVKSNKKEEGFTYKIIDNNIYISSSQENLLKEIELIDLVGRKLIYSKNDFIDINCIHDGVYLLRVTTENGISIKRIKI